MLLKKPLYCGDHVPKISIQSKYGIWNDFFFILVFSLVHDESALNSAVARVKDTNLS